MKAVEKKTLVRDRYQIQTIELVAQAIFTICAFFAVLAVVSITLYMIANGTPAIFQVGIKEILFSTTWKPTAQEPSFGILYVILTSIVGTIFAILIGVPIGLLTAIFLAEIAPKKLAAIVKPAVELLAGIPSVIYGLLGLMILNPLMYRWEQKLFRGSETHQFTGGANLISAVLTKIFFGAIILHKGYTVRRAAHREKQPLRSFRRRRDGTTLPTKTAYNHIKLS